MTYQIEPVSPQRRSIQRQPAQHTGEKGGAPDEKTSRQLLAMSLTPSSTTVGSLSTNRTSPDLYVALGGQITGHSTEVPRLRALASSNSLGSLPCPGHRTPTRPGLRLPHAVSDLTIPQAWPASSHPGTVPTRCPGPRTLPLKSWHTPSPWSTPQLKSMRGTFILLPHLPVFP